MLQGDIISVDNKNFIFIHRKSTPIKDWDEDLIFSLDMWDARPNIIRGLDKSSLKCVRIIKEYFREDKVFYQDNEVGEVVRNFLQESKRAV